MQTQHFPQEPEARSSRPSIYTKRVLSLSSRLVRGGARTLRQMLWKPASEFFAKWQPGLAYQPVVKVQIAEKHPSGAKARHFLSSICGTTEVVPFQNPTFTMGCYAWLGWPELPGGLGGVGERRSQPSFPVTGSTGRIASSVAFTTLSSVQAVIEVRWSQLHAPKASVGIGILIVLGSTSTGPNRKVGKIFARPFAIHVRRKPISFRGSKPVVP